MQIQSHVQRLHIAALRHCKVHSAVVLLLGRAAVGDEVAPKQTLALAAEAALDSTEATASAMTSTSTLHRDFLQVLVALANAWAKTVAVACTLPQIERHWSHNSTRVLLLLKKEFRSHTGSEGFLPMSGIVMCKRLYGTVQSEMGNGQGFVRAYGDGGVDVGGAESACATLSNDITGDNNLRQHCGSGNSELLHPNIPVTSPLPALRSQYTISKPADRSSGLEQTSLTLAQAWHVDTAPTEIA